MEGKKQNNIGAQTLIRNKQVQQVQSTKDQQIKSTFFYKSSNRVDNVLGNKITLNSNKTKMSRN